MSSQADNEIEVRPEGKYLCQAGMDRYHCNNTRQNFQFYLRKTCKNALLILLFWHRAVSQVRCMSQKSSNKTSNKSFSYPLMVTLISPFQVTQECHYASYSFSIAIRCIHVVEYGPVNLRRYQCWERTRKCFDGFNVRFRKISSH